MKRNDWSRASAYRFIYRDGCEINCVRSFGKAKYWTAMVPVMQSTKAWCILSSESGLSKFSSADEAMAAVESYVASYLKKFPSESAMGEQVDLSFGSFSVPGANFFKDLM